MNVQTAVESVRHRNNDVQKIVHPDDELLAYVNMAINTVGVNMILAGNPWAVRELDLPSYASEDLPVGFHSLLQGQRCSISGGKISPDPINSRQRIRYFWVPGPVTFLDNLPFPEPYCTNVVNIATELAGMRTGHDVSQEHALHIAMSGIPQGGVPADVQE